MDAARRLRSPHLFMPLDAFVAQQKLQHHLFQKELQRQRMVAAPSSSSVSNNRPTALLPTPEFGPAWQSISQVPKLNQKMRILLPTPRPSVRNEQSKNLDKRSQVAVTPTKPAPVLRKEIQPEALPVETSEEKPIIGIRERMMQRAKRVSQANESENLRSEPAGHTLDSLSTTQPNKSRNQVTKQPITQPKEAKNSKSPPARHVTSNGHNALQVHISNNVNNNIKDEWSNFVWSQPPPKILEPAEMDAVERLLNIISFTSASDSSMQSSKENSPVHHFPASSEGRRQEKRKEFLQAKIHRNKMRLQHISREKDSKDKVNKEKYEREIMHCKMEQDKIKNGKYEESKYWCRVCGHHGVYKQEKCPDYTEHWLVKDLSNVCVD